MIVKSFPFKAGKIQNVFASNWPVVYIIHDKKEAYIGETTNLNIRINQHISNEDRKNLTHIHMIADETFNMSVTKSYESALIQYMTDEYRLQNHNRGMTPHQFYQKAEYDKKFIELWEKLLEKQVVKKNLEQIRNSDLFKYSPYKELSEEQYTTVMRIHSLLQERDDNLILVKGEPGTGKTILAIFLCKYLASMAEESGKTIAFALVVPMTNLRKTLKKVFHNVSGLSANQVIGPADVVNGNYDLLIVDEAHKLKKRKNIQHYKSFDNDSRKLGLDPYLTDQLEWIEKSSKHQVIFFDDKQKIGPSGIDISRFSRGTEEAYVSTFSLSSQFRVLGGQNYIHYVHQLLANQVQEKQLFKHYEFTLFLNYQDFLNACMKKEKEVGLSRVLAGYAWEWVSKNNTADFDITIENLSRRWNVNTTEWMHSKNASNEIGSVHTIQGYDLNYAGVIIGKDLLYDPSSNRIVVNRDNYYDINGKKSTNNEELLTYIANVYYVLMTRGIRGTYVYVCDEHLRNHLAKYIDVFRSNQI